MRSAPIHPMGLPRSIRPEEILDLGDYERARPEVRERAMAARAQRRVQVGPAASIAFENRQTVHYQIQEMLRAERIASPDAVAHEIDTYSELLPGPQELSATLMLEFPDGEERARRLAKLVGLERHVHLVSGDSRATARFDERQLDPDRVSAVQFIRFRLGDPFLEALRLLMCDMFRRAAPVRLCIDHPAYTHEAALPVETVAAVLRDLEDASP